MSTHHKSVPRAIYSVFLSMTLLLFTYGCSPAYVIQAGLAELKILTSRRPITEVIRDNATPSDLRTKLILVSEARKFASETLAMDVGTSYTTFTQLDRDTLALVLSASPKDTLEPKTWWFPIVGRFPYRGFFDENEALTEQMKLQKEGFDTYLRPTSAFSTLGWFSDPILSTVLKQNEIGVVETVLHELSHNHLFIKDKVDFNESFANFVGRAGTIQFFCTHLDTPTADLLCEQAKVRQADQRRFEKFFSDLIENLRKIYQNNYFSFSEKMAQREKLFEQSLNYFADEIQTNLQILSYQNFRATPINNATLLTQLRYNSRLKEFDDLIEDLGSLRVAIAYVKDNATHEKDPFLLLEN